MSLLTSHLTVHPGILVAVVELLLVAERPISGTEMERLLQPETLNEILGQRPVRNSVSQAIDAAEWFGLAKHTDDGVSPTDSLTALEPHELLRRLPSTAVNGLFGRPWTTEIKTDRADGGDLALAFAWFLAQNPWEAKLTLDDLEMAYARQIDDEQELINSTKMRSVMRWAQYFGFGRHDPINGTLLVPDPTPAIRSTLSAFSESEYPASDFLTELSKLCPVLDNGTIRKITLKSLRDGMLPWETQRNAISPTSSLALYRLREAGQVEFGLRDDAPQPSRRVLSLPEGVESISFVRITGQ